MKIGIITHHYVVNFGAFLQTYALQNALKELYPESSIEIVNYINLKHMFFNIGGWFRYYKDKENFKLWREKVKLIKTFLVNQKKYLNTSKICFTAKQINKLNYDSIVIGSDEVWNYMDYKSCDKVKFGCDLTCKNIISYAPSVGKAQEENPPEYILNGFHNISNFSARDDLTEALIERVIKRKASRVLDPTFLYKIPAVALPKIQTPYILFYYCDGLPDVEKEKILEYAKKNGLNVYGAGECDKRYKNSTVNLTPFEWVWLFKNAHYVITGTFHGVVFSLLNHRQFACYLTNPGRIKKVGSLIKEFGLENRQVNGKASDIIKVLKNEIDYQSLEKIFEIRRNKSLKYLENAIRQQHGQTDI